VPRPTIVTIDLAALRHNLKIVREQAPGASVFAVVKANAYGHGLERAVRALNDSEGLALLEIDAAVKLRQSGYRGRIVLLEGFFETRDLAAFAEYQLDSVVHSVEQVAMLHGAPSGARIDILVKLNTGMNRLGFSGSQLEKVHAELRANAAIGDITLMTHFANADDEHGVDWQLKNIERVAKGVDLPRCYANSAAILRYPETHFEWVRPGIMLYGASPFADRSATSFGLRPVMTLTSEIIAVQHLKRGDIVGYGGTFTAQSDTRMGVVACGYADGYPRHAPNGTPVRVGDTMTGTLGRVSMDMLCVDLRALPQAGVGTPVVLWGEGNPVDDVASTSGTVGYELLCALAARVPVLERE
jgi:alanine racemase